MGRRKERGLKEFLDDHNDIFYHQTAQYWITDLLIPFELKGKLSIHLKNELEGRMLTAFKDEYHYDFPLRMDWKPYKQKIEQVIASFRKEKGLL
jgi:hypothetical protein